MGRVLPGRRPGELAAPDVCADERGGGIIYALAIALYAIRHGTLINTWGFAVDVFGVDGIKPHTPVKTAMFLHENVAIIFCIGLAGLAAFTDRRRWMPFVYVVASATAFAFMVEYGARSGVLAAFVLLAMKAAMPSIGMTRKAAVSAFFAAICAAAIIMTVQTDWNVVPEDAPSAAAPPSTTLLPSVVPRISQHAWQGPTPPAQIPEAVPGQDAMTRTLVEIYSTQPGSRINLALFVVRAALDHPWQFVFGRGLGMYAVDYGWRAPDWLIKPGGASISPHNVFLEVFYGTGIVGLVLFCGMVAAAGWRLLVSCRTLDPARRFVLDVSVLWLVWMNVTVALSTHFMLPAMLGLAAATVPARAKA